MKRNFSLRSDSWVSLLVWSAMSVTLVFFVCSAYRYKRALRCNEDTLNTLLAEQKDLKRREPSVLAQERALETLLRERRHGAGDACAGASR